MLLPARQSELAGPRAGAGNHRVLSGLFGLVLGTGRTGSGALADPAGGLCRGLLGEPRFAFGTPEDSIPGRRHTTPTQGRATSLIASGLTEARPRARRTSGQLLAGGPQGQPSVGRPEPWKTIDASRQQTVRAEWLGLRVRSSGATCPAPTRLKRPICAATRGSVGARSDACRSGTLPSAAWLACCRPRSCCLRVV